MNIVFGPQSPQKKPNADWLQVAALNEDRIAVLYPGPADALIRIVNVQGHPVAEFQCGFTKDRDAQREPSDLSHGYPDHRFRLAACGSHIAVLDRMTRVMRVFSPRGKVECRFVVGFNVTDFILEKDGSFLIYGYSSQTAKVLFRLDDAGTQVGAWLPPLKDTASFAFHKTVRMNCKQLCVSRSGESFVLREGSLELVDRLDSQLLVVSRFLGTLDDFNRKTICQFSSQWPSEARSDKARATVCARFPGSWNLKGLLPASTGVWLVRSKGSLWFLERIDENLASTEFLLLPSTVQPIHQIAPAVDPEMFIIVTASGEIVPNRFADCEPAGSLIDLLKPEIHFQIAAPQIDIIPPSISPGSMGTLRQLWAKRGDLRFSVSGDLSGSGRYENYRPISESDSFSAIAGDVREFFAEVRFEPMKIGGAAVPCLTDFNCHLTALDLILSTEERSHLVGRSIREK